MDINSVKHGIDALLSESVREAPFFIKHEMVIGFSALGSI